MFSSLKIYIKKKKAKALIKYASIDKNKSKGIYLLWMKKFVSFEKNKMLIKKNTTKNVFYYKVEQSNYLDHLKWDLILV